MIIWRLLSDALYRLVDWAYRIIGSNPKAPVTVLCIKCKKPRTYYTYTVPSILSVGDCPYC